MSYPGLVEIKPNRDTAIRAGHPWIFSGAVAKVEKAKRGDLVTVVDYKGDAIGIGTFHPGNSIRVRMISGNPDDVIDAAYLAKRFRELSESKKNYLPEKTDGYRIVNADADYLPGLIVDAYRSCLVFQIHTAGMEKLRGPIIEAIKSLNPIQIVERSDVESRKQDQIPPLRPRVIAGRIEGPVEFSEAGIRMLADPIEGQKTGFYLDQRETRRLIPSFAKGKRVVNLFSYTGGGSVAAAISGADHVISVDSSKPALSTAEEIFRLNGLDPLDDRYRFNDADVFDYLDDAGRPDPAWAGRTSAGRTYDGPALLICDPPAFAKHKRSLENAKKAYLRLNRLCLKGLKPGDLLLTSSCSGMIDRDTFTEILRHAAGTAGRRVSIIEELGAPPDHTKNLSFPEGSYLKTLLLGVTG